ncbi:MAG TPA: arylsulfatase [Verrucomicrobiota bacterium]|nr:arylsulfatase [Verrucomicrobiota bacterium]HNU49755.1 arylsulfatase [Verrucomicrobiota bacterium]
MPALTRELRLALSILTLSCVALGASPRTPASQPPNIILIVADDLGYGDLGCQGQKRIQTPHIDRLAAEGTRFTQFYAGSTVCAPSRCALMTGYHMGHARVRGNAGRANPLAQALRPEDLTVARILQNAGYTTALTGKWGLGDAGAADVGLPRRQGFDFFFGYLNQRHAHNYYPTFLWRNETKVALRNIVPNEDPQGGGVSTNRLDYSPDLILREALDFIRRTRDRPFFLFFASTLPHANNEAGKAGMEIPDTGPYAALDWPAPQKGHAAMITRLDRDVRSLLDLLEELDLDRHTLVFFTSDNGPHREGGNNPEFNDSNGPLRGIKRDLYEGGIRVPMIVRWPGHVPAGAVNNQPWAFWDLLPTVAQLADAPTPKAIDGISMLPVLLGQRQHQPHPPFYWEFHEGGFKQAVRLDRWKAVRLAPSRPLELYDLEEDPGETRDLASTHPTVARKLARLMTRSHRDSPDWPPTAPADVNRSAR